MRHVLSICHKSQPARRKTDADATAQIIGTIHANDSHPQITCESFGRDGDILWKTFPLSSKQVYYAPLPVKNPEKYRLSCLFTVKHRAGMAGLRT
jgi:hypothetical protein